MTDAGIKLIANEKMNAPIKPLAVFCSPFIDFVLRNALLVTLMYAAGLFETLLSIA